MSPQEFKNRLKLVPARERMTVERYCGDGISAAKIARADGITLAAVYARLERASAILGFQLPRHKMSGKPRLSLSVAA